MKLDNLLFALGICCLVVGFAGFHFFNMGKVFACLFYSATIVITMARVVLTTLRNS